VLRIYYNYVEHRDPLAKAGNKIAVFILSNQPFYPLYIYFLVGGRFWPALLTLISSPFYAAVPWVMRKNALAGKWLLVGISLENTLLSIKVLGTDSGLELFLFPCAVLGALIFNANERKSAWIAAIAPIALYLILRGKYGSPLEAFTVAEYASLLTLHAVSAAAISVFVCFTVMSAIRANASASRARPKRK
jgi:hypothetical protein